MGFSMPHITFTPLQPSHFPLLLTWLSTPHVQQWWHHSEPWTFEEVQTKYTPYTQGYKAVDGGQKPIHAYVMCIDGNPIGYIQYYNAYNFPRDNGPLTLETLPKNLAALDLFIGDTNYLGKGLGAPLVTAFLQQHIWPHFDACFVDPEGDNIAAIKAYQKAGFKIIKKWDTAIWMIATK
jgi:RimJ/RimL family protein N-acetyltransferase